MTKLYMQNALYAREHGEVDQFRAHLTTMGNFAVVFPHEVNHTIMGYTFHADKVVEIWDPGMLSALRAMLENNDIEIGENGKTYSRTMYPRGKQKTPRYIVTITDPMTRQTTKKIFDDEYIATRFRAECNRSGRPARMTRKMVEIQL